MRWLHGGKGRAAYRVSGLGGQAVWGGRGGVLLLLLLCYCLATAALEPGSIFSKMQKQDSWLAGRNPLPAFLAIGRWLPRPLCCCSASCQCPSFDPGYLQLPLTNPPPSVTPPNLASRAYRRYGGPDDDGDTSMCDRYRPEGEI